ncbi:MAG TPA: glycosyltransferase family 61 protein [Paracoccus sp. (in: a-proteobacteria)]|nr:glycosyltransferase family 61 protein [Paracoccus sp. (in: a-proteobacteria)]
MHLDLEDVADDITIHRDALVIPPQPQILRREQPSGVLTADGSFVENARNWTDSRTPVNAPPALLPGQQVETLAGRHLFGGVFYGHFGHFIVETLSRVWALDHLDAPVDSLILTPKVIGTYDDALARYQAIFDAFNVRIPVRLVSAPVRVEELVVPRQGFGMNDLVGGSARFRDYVNRWAGHDIAPEGGRKIYISRSRLPPDRGSILGESRLEAYLAAEGYEIYHPQKQTTAHQIARYKAATHIIATDCSPVHMVGHVGNAGQKVAIITRRSTPVGSHLERQLREFKGMEATEINALVNDWVLQPGGRPGRSSFGEVDLAAIQSRLLDLGMIESAAPWANLTRQERDAEVARQAARHKAIMEPFRADA